MSAGTASPHESAARPPGPCPVAVCAPGPALRRRIAAALDEPDIRIVALLEHSAEVERLETGASVLVVALACDVDDGRQMADLKRLCRQRRPLAAVAVSPPTSGPGARRVLDAGAAALVFDTQLQHTLASAVRAVARGQSVVPRECRAAVQRPVLSHRESQVLALLRRGLTNAEIAQHLILAESTIKSHVSSVFSKLGVRSRKEVASALAEVDPREEEAPA